MLSKAEICRKLLKLRALAERPGSAAEGEAARTAIAGLMKEYGITDEDLEIRAGVDAATTGPDRGREDYDRRRGFAAGPSSGRPIATTAAELDHQIKPDRVHLAYDYMTSVCGIRPTFVWVFEREKLLSFEDPCPHCLATGIFDTRNERRRLGPAY